METKEIRFTRIEKEFCLEMVEKMNNRIKEAEGKRFTAFGQFCHESDIKIRDENLGYLKHMQEHGKDYIYVMRDDILPYEACDAIYKYAK